MWHPVPLFLTALLVLVVRQVLLLMYGWRIEERIFNFASTDRNDRGRKIEAKNGGSFSSRVSAAAFIVSIAATWFAWQQLKAAKKHNRLSVTPKLQITSYAEAGGRSGIYISNDGLGPAIVTNFIVRYEDNEWSGLGESRWGGILNAGGFDSVCFDTEWLPKELILKAGADDKLLGLRGPMSDDILCRTEFVSITDTRPIDLEVHYESFYGDPQTLKASSRIEAGTPRGSRTIDSLIGPIYDGVRQRLNPDLMRQ